MKKAICLLMALLLVLPAFTAMAAGRTEEEIFLSQCGWRLRRTVTGYEDAHMTVPSRTVPIGTYCKITVDFDDVVRIMYREGGAYYRVHVYRSDLIGAYTQYRQPDGTTGVVYTGDPDYEKTLEGNEVTWLAESLQTDLDGQVEAEGNAPQGGSSSGGSSSGGSSSGGSSSGGSSSGGSSSGGSTHGMQSTGSDDLPGGVSVVVVTLGVHTSVVEVDGERQELPTDELAFAAGVPDEKKVAYIYAPESGQCTLRRSASESGSSIQKCRAGTVVAVLDIDGQWTKIRYKDEVGYVLTRCLAFCHPGRGIVGEGMLTLKGNGSGRAEINVRNAPTRESVVIKTWKTGTVVTVFALSDGWYEIEYNGMHGFVREDYLTLQ